MNPETVLYTIEFWLALAFLIIFAYGPWQEFIESAVRHKLFKVRDELFDYAAKGNVSFEHDDYKRVREALNDFIRFAHVMSWSHALLGRKLAPSAGDGFRDLMEFDEGLSKDVQDQLRAAVLSGVSTMLVLIILRSPLLMAALMLFAPLMLLVQLFNNKDYHNKLLRKLKNALYREMELAR